jgi:hypothetical protein
MGTLNLSNGVSLSATGTAFGNSAASWSDAPPGTIIQCKSYVDDSAVLVTGVSVSDTWTDTGMQITIEPRKSNSLLVIQSTIRWQSSESPSHLRMRIFDSTNNANLADPGGSNFSYFFYNAGGNTIGITPLNITINASNTTSRTYKLQVYENTGQTVTLGVNDYPHSFTIFEVAQ